ncbi:ribosome biogenesis protein SLX9 homolog [Eriocheir sinensis]|uniref:ribosome biogenesis protein SLX9 homolog n=1 Tax=Eriocheir sinensis TaxID=95602 RepID=UPI0021C81DA1|nr:ribosome biogenesis protein SLX9 homolog [Eriocheir sinensis]
MGKVKRLRQKYHLSLAKEKAEKASAGQNATNSVPQLVPQIHGATSSQKERDNIFAGLQIKLGAAGTLPATKQVEPDNMSVVSLGQQSQMEPKAEKRKKRRMELLKKIDVVRAGQQEEKDRRKREKTVVTGDMHPLLNALPSLGELMASQNEKTHKSKKPKGTPKMKIVKKETLSDIEMFTSVHQDPQFTNDPFKAVALALENRVLNAEY